MEFFVRSGWGLAGLFVAMMAMLELGRAVGRRRWRTDPKWENRGVNTLENTQLALLGLLLAFTFSGAWTRFDARRELILRESNAVGTAWLRLDLLPTESRERLRADFRRYLERRMADAQARAVKPSVEVAALQQAIWAEAIAQSRAATDGRLGQLLLPALNDMFDIATARYQAVQAHPPVVVYLMLIANTLLACLLAGYGLAASADRHWLHVLCFVGTLLMAIYVSFDLEYPRQGLVRVSSYDQLLLDQLAGMK